MLPETAALLVFLAAALALNIAPGPDMLYVIGRSMADGRRAGVVAALGIFAGCMVHVFAAGLGLAALLHLVPALYAVLKYGGMAYLLWIGFRMIRHAGIGVPPAVAPAPLGPIFRQGVVTNVLNPKVALFFVAFLPQFVSPEAAHPALQMIALGLIFDLGGTLINVAVACGFGTAGDWLRRKPQIWRWQQRVSGAIFVGLALRLALPERR
jgi:threonine/homoserine/homoserine lactone efflux protein